MRLGGNRRNFEGAQSRLKRRWEVEHQAEQEASSLSNSSVYEDSTAAQIEEMVERSTGVCASPYDRQSHENQRKEPSTEEPHVSPFSRTSPNWSLVFVSKISNYPFIFLTSGLNYLPCLAFQLFYFYVPNIWGRLFLWRFKSIILLQSMWWWRGLLVGRLRELDTFHVPIRLPSWQVHSKTSSKLQTNASKTFNAAKVHVWSLSGRHTVRFRQGLSSSKVLAQCTNDIGTALWVSSSTTTTWTCDCRPGIKPNPNKNQVTRSRPLIKCKAVFLREL